MAFSGSTDFDMNAAQIIKDALILCGGLEDDETPSANQEEHALRALNRMVKAWSKRGLKAWCNNELTLTLVAGTPTYTVGPTGALTTDRPLQISNARKVVDGAETEIRIVDRSTYMNQPNKTDTGQPVFVYYDPQLVAGVLYVWPAPDDTHQIKFTAQQLIEDFDASTNNPYFPTDWLEAIVYNLALRLCPMYEVSGEDRSYIAQMAAQFLNDAENGDSEQGSVFLSPEYCY